MATHPRRPKQTKMLEIIRRKPRNHGIEINNRKRAWRVRAKLPPEPFIGRKDVKRNVNNQKSKPRKRTLVASDLERLQRELKNSLSPRRRNDRFVLFFCW